MNWNVVSNGGMTVAALALADVPRYASVAKEALKFAREGIPLALSGYGPKGDGAWPEGPGYWVYTTKWLLAESEILVTATGADNGYMETEGVRDTGMYALQMYQTPSGDMFNYGDAGDISIDSEVSSNLLGLAQRFPELAGPVGTAVRPVLENYPQQFSDAGGCVGLCGDVIALLLMRWDAQTNHNRSISTAKDDDAVIVGGGAQQATAASTSTKTKMPLASFYSAQGVGVVRSGWDSHSSYLGAKGGDSSVTHQDLDHGSFVWETRGYRWAIDLGIESYGLPNMFLPFKGRYTYYRKSTRGHNTLTFGEVGGFNPDTAEVSDQTLNIFSSLVPGNACKGKRSGIGSKLPSSCGAGEVIVVNLTNACSPKFPNGTSDPTVPDAKRAKVLRSFHVNKNMSILTVADTIGNNPKNITWIMHTRASFVAGTNARSSSNASALLKANDGLQVRIEYKSKPSNMCGGWHSTLVKLPNGTQYNQTRFPLHGARKVWVVCQQQVSELQVTITDV